MSKAEKDKIRAIQEKCVAIISQLLREEDNKYCVDCDAKGPRWASWNLGIFLCIRCAGIHRNLGVHISRVKSVNLDTWTPEQVGSLQQMGNSKGRAVYEANLPDNFRRPSSDSSLDSFIRAKYEHKKYIAKEWVPAPARPAFSTDEIGKKKDDRKRSKPITPLAKSSAAPVARPKASSDAAPVTPQPLDSSPQPKTTTNDLLGLDLNSKEESKQGGDMFGLFMTGSDQPTQTNGAIPEQSNVPSSNTNDSLQPSKANEGEDSFFKQTGEQAGNKKMTNESILSLFASSNPQPTNPQMFGMPGGMYVGAQQPQVIPQQAVQNGMVLNSGAYQPNGMVQNQSFMAQPNLMNPATQQQTAIGMGANPFVGTQMQQPIPGNYAPSNPYATANNPSQLFPTNQQQQNISLASNDLIGWNAPNKQYSGHNFTNQMQQQMSAMQINAGGGPTPQGWNMAGGGMGQMPTQSTNMWMQPQSDQSFGQMPMQGQTLSNNLWK